MSNRFLRFTRIVHKAGVAPAPLMLIDNQPFYKADLMQIRSVRPDIGYSINEDLLNSTCYEINRAGTLDVSNKNVTADIKQELVSVKKRLDMYTAP